MGILQGLEPQPVFKFFEEICGIPHTSYHEKALSDYCAAFARERGLEHRQDEMGNVIIIAEATPGYEEAEPVILQGHLDMVGDKTEDCSLDLEKDGLRLQVEGDYISAEGTTLGSDDGIAVAYALALLDAEDIPHPRLEVVLTVGEEVGLLGAAAVDLSMCRGRRLLNVDSEVEGILTAGCAGGVRVGCHVPVTRRTRSGVSFNVSLEGLKGGHSGMDIDKGRANANILMGRFLLLLRDRTEYGVVELSGGARENVIPKSASLVLVLKQENTGALRAVAEEFRRQIEAEYKTADPGIRLILEEGTVCEAETADEDSLGRIIDLLNLMPFGVQAMSADLPGLVETSANPGVMKLEADGVQMALGVSVRSSVASAKEQTARRAALLTERLGGTAEFSGDYPAWPYARESKFRDLCAKVFEEQYGRKPEIVVIHAGLECGILSGKLEGLDCISIGPDLIDIHTPRERMSISSAERVWEYIKAVLAAK
ncbi:MAG: aminoacyl-histidine dipeptidase [Eubacteriales bacterium]|nr:aminoacyl-histidine dipeptidase [Eubacteriales bacterium]